MAEASFAEPGRLLGGVAAASRLPGWGVAAASFAEPPRVLGRVWHQLPLLSLLGFLGDVAAASFAEPPTLLGGCGSSFLR